MKYDQGSNKMGFTTNPEALAWVESYARCEISLDELRKRMRDALGKRMIHNPHYRYVYSLIMAL